MQVLRHTTRRHVVMPIPMVRLAAVTAVINGIILRQIQIVVILRILHQRVHVVLHSPIEVGRNGMVLPFLMRIKYIVVISIVYVLPVQ